MFLYLVVFQHGTFTAFIIFNSSWSYILFIFFPRSSLILKDVLIYQRASMTVLEYIGELNVTVQFVSLWKKLAHSNSVNQRISSGRQNTRTGFHTIFKILLVHFYESFELQHSSDSILNLVMLYFCIKGLIFDYDHFVCHLIITQELTMIFKPIYSILRCEIM